MPKFTNRSLISRINLINITELRDTGNKLGYVIPEMQPYTLMIAIRVVNNIVQDTGNNCIYHLCQHLESKVTADL